jgi:TPR repeat protein
MDDEINTGSSGKIPAAYKTLMIAIAVITLLVVWLLPGNEESEPQPLPELPGSQQAEMDLPEPGGESGAIIRDGDMARSFIAGLREGHEEHDPDTVFVEAERLQGEGFLVDAHLLYRFAARHGHGPAAMELGTQSDPAYFDATSPDTLKDNPEQAYKWYSMAAAAGIEEAVTRLQALHQNVEMSASAGDERAQRLLLLWK